MSRRMKALIVVMSLIFGFIVASYLNSYYWAMDKAREYMREGDYELAEDMLDFAHSRIRNMFILILFWTSIMTPIIYHSRKSSSVRKQ